MNNAYLSGFIRLVEETWGPLDLATEDEGVVQSYLYLLCSSV